MPKGAGSSQASIVGYLRRGDQSRFSSASLEPRDDAAEGGGSVRTRSGVGNGGGVYRSAHPTRMRPSRPSPFFTSQREDPIIAASRSEAADKAVWDVVDEADRLLAAGGGPTSRSPVVESTVFGVDSDHDDDDFDKPRVVRRSQHVLGDGLGSRRGRAMRSCSMLGPTIPCSSGDPTSARSNPKVPRSVHSRAPAVNLCRSQTSMQSRVVPRATRVSSQSPAKRPRKKHRVDVSSSSSDDGEAASGNKADVCSLSLNSSVGISCERGDIIWKRDSPNFLPSSAGRDHHAPSSSHRKKRKLPKMFPEDGESSDDVLGLRTGKTPLYEHGKMVDNSSSDDDALLTRPLSRSLLVARTRKRKARRLENTFDTGEACSPGALPAGISVKPSVLLAKDTAAEDHGDTDNVTDASCEVPRTAVISLDTSSSEGNGAVAGGDGRSRVPAAGSKEDKGIVPKRVMLSVSEWEPGLGDIDIEGPSKRLRKPCSKRSLSGPASSDDRLNTDRRLEDRDGSSEEDDDDVPILRLRRSANKRKRRCPEGGQSLVDVKSKGELEAAEIVIVHRNANPPMASENVDGTPVAPPQGEWMNEREIGDFSDSGPETPSRRFQDCTMRVPVVRNLFETSGGSDGNELESHDRTPRKTREPVFHRRYLREPTPSRGVVDACKESGAGRAPSENRRGINLNDRALTSNKEVTVVELGSVHDEDENAVLISSEEVSQDLEAGSSEPLLELSDSSDVPPPAYDVAILCQPGESLQRMVERLGEDHVMQEIFEAQDAGRPILGAEELGIEDSNKDEISVSAAQRELAMKFRNCTGKPKERYTYEMATASMAGAKEKYEKLYQKRNAKSSRRGGRFGRGRRGRRKKT